MNESNINDILSMGDLEDVSSLLTLLMKYVEDKGKEINSSQLRNIFSKVLQAEKVIDIQLIRPKLMYIAARHDKKDFKAKEVILFLEKIAAQVKKETQVKNFQIFMEAFVAYHKYYDTKKKL